MKKILLIVLLLMLNSCTQSIIISSETDDEFIRIYKDDSISNLQVEEVKLKDGFIIGADISSLNEVEIDHEFYDVDGTEKDFFDILKNNGFNYIRLRQFVEPFDNQGNLYGGGSNTLENNIELIKRANDKGLKVLLDFHYSDFWADPQNQVMPRSFAEFNEENLLKRIYSYTYETLRSIQAAGGNVSMVQIGNEINNGLMHPYGKEKNNMYKILKAGIKATNDFNDDIRIMIHYAGVNNINFYRKLISNNIDFDVIGLSYYPRWHGNVKDLSSNLAKFEQFRDKDVIIVEYSYAFTDHYEKNAHNTLNSDSEKEYGYKFTVQGQTTFIRDVNYAVNSIKNGSGSFYWEVAWLPGENTSWANDFAYHFYNSSYNFNVVGHANQSLFSYSGKALKSIQVFKLMENSNDKEEIIRILSNNYAIPAGTQELTLEVLTSLHRYQFIQVVLEDKTKGTYNYCLNKDVCTEINIT